MNNAELKREADQLVLRCGLRELLAPYGDWFVGGSYSYDLMCWRDIDVYALDPAHDLKRCFEIACELTRRLSAKKASFTDNLGGEPSGLYWGIKLGDTRRGAWKLDLWLLDPADYERHVAYSSRLRERLTAETRAAILAIKEAYWQQACYRDTITSDMIYRAVLDNGVRSVGEFEEFIKDCRA